jgi:hypothetical protein
MNSDHPLRTTAEVGWSIGAILYPLWVRFLDEPLHGITAVLGIVSLVLLIYNRLLDSKIKRRTLRGPG